MRTNLLEKTFESFSLGLNKKKTWLLVLGGVLLILLLVAASMWYFQQTVYLHENETSLFKLLLQ